MTKPFLAISLFTSIFVINLQSTMVSLDYVLRHVYEKIIESLPRPNDAWETKKILDYVGLNRCCGTTRKLE